jgi:hypothetical protein
MAMALRNLTLIHSSTREPTVVVVQQTCSKYSAQIYQIKEKLSHNSRSVSRPTSFYLPHQMTYGANGNQ